MPGGRLTKYGEMFNEELKNRFIQQGGYQPASVDRYEKFFRRIGHLERKYEKDLYDFNLEELKNLLYDMNSGSAKKLNSDISIVRMYKKWCYSQGYGTNINETRLINIDEIANMVSRVKVRQQFLSGMDELMTLCQYCTNKQDGAIFILLFYGIRTDKENMDELINLKESDCDFINNTITVNNRKIEIPHDFMKYLHQAVNQTIYGSSGKSRDYNIANTKYVLKKANTGMHFDIEEKMTVTGITQRIMKSIKSFDKPYLNAFNVYLSGMFYHLSVIEKTKELTFEDFTEMKVKYNMIDTTHPTVLKDRYDEWKSAMQENKEIAMEKAELVEQQKQKIKALEKNREE